MTLPVAPLVRPSDLHDQANGMLEPHLLTAVEGDTMHHLAAQSWRAMQSAARADGVRIAVGADAYRPLSVQHAIWVSRYRKVATWRPGARKYQGSWWVHVSGATAAVPGTSNHGWGLAVDVDDCSTESTAACRWLKANAHRFGWSAEIQSEAWHWRAVHGDRLPPAVAPVPPPLPAPTPGDDDVLIGFYRLQARGEVYAVHTDGTKKWVPDAAALEAARAVAAFSGVDPSLRVVNDAASMRALGPIVGPVPAGVDPWGA